MTDASEASAHALGTRARSANRDDAAALSEMLGRAFFDDPLMCFLLPNENGRHAKMRRLFELLFKLALPFGACDVTGNREAAALWRPPGHWHVPLHQYVTHGREFLGIFGPKMALRAFLAMDQIEKRHPKEPHFYLQVIGTDPVRQGKGFGGAVMRRHLEIADAAGMPTYLESSKERNIPIYQNFGFELKGEIRLRDGPTLYPMWRKAAK